MLEMNGWGRHLCVCVSFALTHLDISVYALTVQQDLQVCVCESCQQLWLRCPSLIALCKFMYLDLCVCV